MKKILLSFAIIFSTTTFISAQKTVAGVTMPGTVKLGSTELKLNGAGVREKMWLDLYACGLYVTTTSKDAQKIIDSEEACGIKIQIVSGLISSKKMNDAVEEGFEKSTGGKTADLRKQIDAFKAIFSKEEIVKNDIYDIMFIPEKGIIVFKNGKIHPVIKGLDFKKALFAIWLGTEPADEDLKDDLLGK